MADSQKSMVSIVAIIAVVILVGLVVWFIRDQQSDGIEIDIGAASVELVQPGTPSVLHF